MAQAAGAQAAEQDDGWSEWKVRPDGFRERSRVRPVDPNEPIPEPNPLLAGHWGEERKQPDGSIKRSWVFTHPDHPANKTAEQLESNQALGGHDRNRLPGNMSTGLLPGGAEDYEVVGNLALKQQSIAEVFPDRAEVIEFPGLKLVEPAPAKPAPTPAKPKKKPQSRSAKVVVKSQAVLALETILPIVPSGWWWEVSANAKGFKIDLRWRENGKKTGHTFSRLGKNKYESILEKDHAKQFWIIYDRLIGELEADERDSHRQAATRIRLRTLND